LNGSHIYIHIRICLCRPLRLCFIVFEFAVTKGVDVDVDGGVNEEDGAISVCCGTFEDAVPGERGVGTGTWAWAGLWHGHSNSRGNICEHSCAHSTMTTMHSESLSISLSLGQAAMNQPEGHQHSEQEALKLGCSYFSQCGFVILSPVNLFSNLFLHSS